MGGDKEFERVLKALITGKNRYIEYKGQDGFFIENFARVIIASNNDWVVPMGMDDRRFVSCNVSKGRVGDGEYFKAIHEQMENGGSEALMYDLLQEDLSGWNPRQRPSNAIRHALDQKLMSMSPLEKFIFGWVVDKEVAKYRQDPDHSELHRVPHNELFEEYVRWCEKLNIHHRLDTKTFALKVWGKLIPYAYAFRYMGRKTVYLVPSAENIIEYYEREVIKQKLSSDKNTEDDSEAVD